MKYLVTSFIVGALFCQSALADIAVIVHPSNTAEVSQDDVVRLFLGKEKNFQMESRQCLSILRRGMMRAKNLTKKY